MNRIVKILMRRDEITREEAEEMVSDAKKMIAEAIEEGREYDVEDIVLDELGLEMDYIIDLL